MHILFIFPNYFVQSLLEEAAEADPEAEADFISSSEEDFALDFLLPLCFLLFPPLSESDPASESESESSSMNSLLLNPPPDPPETSDGFLDGEDDDFDFDLDLVAPPPAAAFLAALADFF